MPAGSKWGGAGSHRWGGGGSGAADQRHNSLCSVAGSANSLPDITVPLYGVTAVAVTLGGDALFVPYTLFLGGGGGFKPREKAVGPREPPHLGLSFLPVVSHSFISPGQYKKHQKLRLEQPDFKDPNSTFVSKCSRELPRT